MLAPLRFFVMILRESSAWRVGRSASGALCMNSRNGPFLISGGIHLTFGNGSDVPSRLAMVEPAALFIDTE
jgi:hypothetical protein